MRLLIVDDEIATRKGLVEFVNWAEVGVDEVIDASDGEEALAISETFCPDIVLTDVRMPRMDGIELARCLRQQHPMCKVLFLSGHSDKEYLMSAIHLQAVSYLEKPVDLEEVKETVRKTVQVSMEQQQRLTAEFASLALYLLKPFEEIAERRQTFIRLTGTDPDALPFVCIVISAQQRVQKPLFSLAEHTHTLIAQIQEFSEKSGISALTASRNDGFLLSVLYGKILKDPAFFMYWLHDLRGQLIRLLPPEETLMISGGDMVIGLERLPQSLQTAILARQCLFFNDQDHVAFGETPSDRVLDLSEYETAKFQNLLMNSDREAAHLFIKRLCCDLRKHNGTLISNIKTTFFHLALGLSKTSTARGILLAQDGNTEEVFWDVISGADTLQQLELFLAEKIDRYYNRIEEKISGSSVIMRCIQEIERHMGDSELSISQLAERTYVTPNYLSSLFKREIGKTINQYITELRMEKARTLLNDPQMKLYEVATRVGFTDINYFARLFRRHFGLNPSDFRKRLTS